jgi:hypothetical protein
MIPLPSARAMARSTVKKTAKAGISSVPSPKPEKSVSAEVMMATRQIMKYAIAFSGLALGWILGVSGPQGSVPPSV